MNDEFGKGGDGDAVDRYLAATVPRDGAAGGSGEQSDDDARAAGGDDEVFARCDAVLALTPKLADTPELAWAFAEAREIASGKPASRYAPWYRRLTVAWSAAALASAACVALAVVLSRGPAFVPGGLPIAESGLSAASAPLGAAPAVVEYTPIPLPPGIESDIADIAPVVLIAGTVPVDGRSIAVIPFSMPISAGRAGPIEAAARSVYERTLQQLAAIPGITVIDPAATAAYASLDLSPEEIALFLSARSIVEGNVGFDGDMVRLDLRITDVAGEGRSVERDLVRPIAELAALQDDILANVLDTLGAGAGFARTPWPMEMLSRGGN